MPIRRSNVLVSKSGCTSIRRPPGSTTASAQLGSRCVGDFLAANSTGTNRPAFSSNAAFSDGDPVCRSSNLDSGKTRSAAYRCSQTQPPTAELPLVYVAWALTTLFLRSSGHFNTDPTCRTGVLVRRLRFCQTASRNPKSPLMIGSLMNGLLGFRDRTKSANRLDVDARKHSLHRRNQRSIACSRQRDSPPFRALRRQSFPRMFPLRGAVFMFSVEM
jgi:hypothetical protein